MIISDIIFGDTNVIEDRQLILDLKTAHCTEYCANCQCRVLSTVGMLVSGISDSHNLNHINILMNFTKKSF